MVFQDWIDKLEFCEVAEMLNYRIRKCKTTDAKTIYELNTKEMGYDYSEAKTKEKIAEILMSNKDIIYVACMDDSVIGYVHANDYDVIYAPHMKNIMGIAVSNSFKRNGVGAALLQAVEDWAQKTGAQGIRLASGSNRADAHIFYQHCGYNEDKRQLRFCKMF